MNDGTATSATPVADWRNDPGLSATWKFRFDFFEKYGIPISGMMPAPECKAALTKLSFGDRMKINMNWYAFFFGFIYFGFFLKLWRQALILIGFALVYGILATILNFPDAVDKGVSIAYALTCSSLANALYYRKRTQGNIGWRFF